MTATDTPPPPAQLLVPLLAAGATALAVVLFATERSSGLETLGVITGAVCVWLTVRESNWNFPFSLASVVFFSIIFFRARLFADAGLQVVFFILTLTGWYLWLFGGAHRSSLHITRTPRGELAIVVAAVIASTFLLWLLLTKLRGSASFFDALTTSLSLGAQWLLNRKRVENWWFWIVADVIYVPLYAYKQLYLTSALYAVFLAMATTGLIEWRRAWREEQIPFAATAPVSAAGTQVPA